MWGVYWLLLERSIRGGRRSSPLWGGFGGGGKGKGVLSVGRHGGEIWFPLFVVI